MPQPMFTKLGVCISWQLSPSQRRSSEILSISVCVCISLLSLQGNSFVKFIPQFGAGQRFGKHVPAATNTRCNRRIVGRVILCAIRALSKESLWVCLYITLSLLGSNSVKSFLRQRRIVGDVVLYAVRVV
jgi:hypothetical protein